LWIKQLLLDLKIVADVPIPIYKDNQSCIHAHQSWDQKRMKHIDVKYNIKRDLQQKGIFSVRYIQSRDQKADILTKPLAPEIFREQEKILA